MAKLAVSHLERKTIFSKQSPPSKMKKSMHQSSIFNAFLKKLSFLLKAFFLTLRRAT